MAKRLLIFISALFLLVINSNCTGIKPFYNTGNISTLMTPGSKQVSLVNRYSDNYGYVPSPAKEKGMFAQNNRQYKFSVSFPVKVKVEF